MNMCDGGIRLLYSKEVVVRDGGTAGCDATDGVRLLGQKCLCR